MVNQVQTIFGAIFQMVI